MKRWIAVGLIATALAGCSSEPKPTTRTPANPHIFDATSMRIHPVFTKVADFDGDNLPDGVEAVLQFQDQFGDPTKAVGRVTFELFVYRPYNPDPRGPRVCPPFEGRLDSMQDQRARWNNATGAYIFQLQVPGVKITTDYTLTATFEPLTGGRFTDTDVIEGDHQKPGSTQPAPLTTQPSTQPATQASGDTTAGAIQVVGQPSTQESTSAPAHQPPARSDQP
jgi:hypothetical protein